MADVTIFFTGYNQITQGYNRGGYNQDVAFTGLTASAGSVTALAGTIVSVTSVAATGSVGSVTVTAGTGATIEAAGIEATGGAGTINIWGPVDTSQTPSWTAVTDSQTPNWSEVA
jgi:hypothetical protein